MKDLHEILYELKAGKKLRFKTWSNGLYIHYWNKVVLDQTGGLVDIVHFLVISRPNEWELFPSDEVKFRDLAVGERFKWIPGDHIHVKIAIDKLTPAGEFVKYRFTAYNTVLNVYRDFGPEALVRRVSE